jgi:hypothetical protein
MIAQQIRPDGVLMIKRTSCHCRRRQRAKDTKKRNHCSRPEAGTRQLRRALHVLLSTSGNHTFPPANPCPV